MQLKKLKQVFALLTVAPLLYCNSLRCFAADNNSVANNSSLSANFQAVVCDTDCQKGLQILLDNYREKYQIVGMELGVSLGEKQTTLLFYSGAPTKEGKGVLNKDSLFAVGSATKAFTAVLILQLEAEGKLKLDDTVAQWLLQYANSPWSDLKIRELLNMTSGAYDYTHLKEYEGDFLHNHVFKCLAEVVKLAYKQMPNINFSPGVDWEYSNTGYILAGMIIEKITNKSAQANMYERIIKPNNLSNTIYDPTTHPIDLPNMVHAYYYNKDKELIDTTEFNLSALGTAGGLISTPDDTIKFIRALFSGKIIPLQQFSELTNLLCVNTEKYGDKNYDNKGRCSPTEPLSPTADQRLGYGLGIFEYSDSDHGIDWWHDGSIVYAMVYHYYINKDLIITVFGNVGTDERTKDNYFTLVKKAYDCLSQKGLCPK